MVKSLSTPRWQFSVPYVREASSFGKSPMAENLKSPWALGFRSLGQSVDLSCLFLLK